jgi:hypothetical protein
MNEKNQSSKGQILSQREKERKIIGDQERG